MVAKQYLLKGVCTMKQKILKKIFASCLILTMFFTLVACGNNQSEKTNEDSNMEPMEEQPVEMDEQDSREDETLLVEEEEKEPSFTFSDMPVAVYEVTGLDLNGDLDDGDYPLIKLTPGENKFTLFCMLGDDTGEYSISKSKIHSQNGDKWQAITFTCLDAAIDPPEGYSILTRQEDDKFSYDEDTYDASFFSLVDPWLDWLRFTLIYHPDQNDTIYIIDVAPSAYEDEYNTIEETLGGMERAFKTLGASNIEEIDIEEALSEYNIEIS